MTASGRLEQLLRRGAFCNDHGDLLRGCRREDCGLRPGAKLMVSGDQHARQCKIRQRDRWGAFEIEVLEGSRGRLLFHGAPGVDDIVGDNAEADPAVHSEVTSRGDTTFRADVLRTEPREL